MAAEGGGSAGLELGWSRVGGGFDVFRLGLSLPLEAGPRWVSACCGVVVEVALRVEWPLGFRDSRGEWWCVGVTGSSGRSGLC